MSGVRSRRGTPPLAPLLLLLLLAPAAARAAGDEGDLPVVAVFDIEVQRVPLAAAARAALSELLATELAAGGAYRVVPRDQLQRRLTKQKRASYRACYSQTCQIEIGKELAAQKSLATRAARLGQRCVVSATLYDLKRATSERAATTEEPSCGEAALTRAVKTLAQKLSARPAASQPAERPDGSGSSAGDASTDVPAGADSRTLTIGPKRARVTIEEFTDYQCAYCKASREAIFTALKSFRGKVRYVHRDFPLDDACHPTLQRPFHTEACRAAYYARCAAQQNKGWAMDVALFAAAPTLDEPTMRAAAKKLQLNLQQLDRCLGRPAVRQQVLDDLRLGQGHGIQGTPTIIVNSDTVSGARSAEWWVQKIRELLK